MKFVEQVSLGKVSIEKDRTRTQSALRDFFTRFGGVVKAKKGFWLNIHNEKLLILTKNVTYLGHPHPLFKKRIQIPKEWNELLRNQTTLLVGVYTGPKEDLIVLFANANFVNKRLNSSSAHVSTVDLLKGSEDGFFSKIDARGNFIQVFKIQEFEDFLCEFTSNLHRIKNVGDQLQWYRSKSMAIKTALTPCIEYAKDIIGETWLGVKAYEEMHKANYSKAYEAEWSGWYNEFKFELFVKPKYSDLVDLHSDDLDLDLDLRFKSIPSFLGDLKAHSNNQGIIIGNDLSTLINAVSRYGKFWLVVTEHDTVKDKDKGLVTRDYWNKIKREAKKGNPNADYSGRMKYSVTITSLKVLEINDNNLKYVVEYAQGRQPDGSPRNLKFAISKRTIDNFVLYRT